MGKITNYTHHLEMMAVDEDLKGKHREHCLCYRCARFNPDNRENNCSAANLLYAVDCACGMVTPVWECSKFINKD